MTAVTRLAATASRRSRATASGRRSSPRRGAVVDAAGRRFGFAVEWSEHPRRRRRDRRATASRSGRRTSRPAAAADAILLGAVGGPNWADPSAPVRPGAGALRAARRPRAVRQPPAGHASTRRSIASSPLRPELLDGVDLLIVRELTGGPLLRRAPRSRRPDAGEASDGASTRCRTRRPRSAASSSSPSSWPRGRPRPRDERRQGERPRDLAAVAEGRRGDRRRASRRRRSTTSSSTRARCSSSGGPRDST